MNKKFLRLNELASLHRKDINSYFHKLNDEIRNHEFFKDLHEKFLLSYENALSELDTESWSFLKKEAEGLCIKKDATTGRWLKFFETLNEARGYVFLKSKGYTSVRFIPRSRNNNIETPDLMGEREGSTALCEVKTKNISLDCSFKRDNSLVIRANELLPDSLKKLLTKTFKKAESQLNSYQCLTTSEKYIYLIIDYDSEGVDSTYKEKLDTQTRKLFDTLDIKDINLVIHNNK